MVFFSRVVLRPTTLRALRGAAFVACGSYCAQHAQCGFFGKSSTDLAKEEEEQQKRDIKAKLGPLASLDLNGDGKVDEKDFMLAMQLARDKAMIDGGGEAVLQKIGGEASKLLATGVPSQLSWGFCSGYCAGFAAKKVGKFVAVFVGGVFCLLQGLAYNGYIVVDQAKIEKDFNDLVDINKDGTLDSKDLQAIYNKLYEVLNYNMPSGSGFAAGLLLGLRSG
ncbi:hypothetical protein CTAYLR_002924 [Chrysophaeum taylorii]|uniref:EF-hand domain-containing protein n=1 Tax=Chrysophaeum taylorii TaxID=2483200 RepID=A0AAD7UNL8_9STRA|nr:hypothetical protein CTAYLR_002924 [Chrysophaeum taylorii]